MSTCINQKPLVKKGDIVSKGDIIAEIYYKNEKTEEAEKIIKTSYIYSENILALANGDKFLSNMVCTKAKISSFDLYSSLKIKSLTNGS